MKLISMTNFVLDQNKKFEPSIAILKLDKLVKYAHFLNQPVELGMFVPCGKNGAILDYSDRFKSCEKGALYGKALEKVLFKTEIDISTAKFHVSQNRRIEYFTTFEIELTETAVKYIFGSC
jgi:hypothetical protein